MINVGIVGISGYTGKFLLKILLNHPKVRINYIAAGSTKGKLEEIHPEFIGKSDLVCDEFDLQKAADHCDVVFLAVPHTKSIEITPGLLKAGKRVIDLSADYRLKNADTYQAWYEKAHTDPQSLAQAVYGLPELYKEDIKNARLLANPGCYPTAAILALAPFVSTQTRNIQTIVIDAKSGVSGAGRKATLSLHFCEVNENFKAYKVLAHQHTPEINQCLSQLAQDNVDVTFVAHLLPINQGIYETIYVHCGQAVNAEKTHQLYTKFYKTEPFVRVLPLSQQPEIKNIVNTNYCDIGLAAKGNLLVITASIDNLVKGAAGQAVQNMNIMYGFPENTGLTQ